MTGDILSFKTGHLISTMKRCLTWYSTRNSLWQNYKGNFHVDRSLPEIHVMNQTQPIQNSHFLLLTLTLLTWRKWWTPNNASKWQMGFNSAFKGLIQTFVLSSNQYQAAKVSMTRIYAGRSGVQISAGAIELSILQKIQTTSSAHPVSKSMKSRAFLWQ